MISSDTVKAALAAIKRPADYEYFFSRLTSPDWINPLKDAGFFNAPYPPERDGGYVRFPLWPESRYLARVANSAPKLVCDTILKIPDTENVRVHEDCIDAALAMPANQAARIVGKAQKWVDSPYQLLLPQKLAELIVLLASNGQAQVALRLAGVLLSLNAAAADQDSDTSPTRDPRARFDTWTYQEIADRVLYPLIDASGTEALALFCELLAAGIGHTRPKDDEAGEDYSYIWHAAIEDHAQNELHGFNPILVTAIRNGAERICAWGVEHVEPVVTVLESHRWMVFKRIALHIIRLHYADNQHLAATRLGDRDYFDSSALRHEYTLLAQAAFAQLPDNVRRQILGWIDEGIEIETIKRIRKDTYGEQVTDEQAQETREHLILERLAPFQEVLPAEWLARLSQLEARFGKPEHPDFVSYSSGVVWGPTSPITVDELGRMSDDALIEYLRTWAAQGDLMGPSKEGLGREFEALVSSQSSRFAAMADRIQELDPTYVRSLLQGLRQAIREKRAITPWKPVLRLCSTVVAHPPDKAREHSSHEDGDLDWEWARSAAAALLWEGLTQRPAGIPCDCATDVWAVLLPLTEDPQPSQEYEARYGGTNMDPATLSLNTVRGHAMHAVIQFALWIWRCNGVETQPDQALSAPEYAETRAVLDRHLDPNEDASLAIRAVYGWYLPTLAWLDKEWTARHVRTIFPNEEALQPLRNAAWTAFLQYVSTPNMLFVFDLVHEEYARDIEQLKSVTGDGSETTDVNNRLAEHLIILYLRRRVELSEDAGLLKRFFDAAPAALRAHALNFACHDLYDSRDLDINPDTLERLTALWTARFTALHNLDDPAHELAAFGWIFASGLFPDDWSMEQLHEVARVIGSSRAYHLVLQRLSQIAAAMPETVIDVLTQIAKGSARSDNYLWPEAIGRVLEVTVASDNASARQKSIELINWFGARGEHWFRGLLPGA